MEGKNDSVQKLYNRLKDMCVEFRAAQSTAQKVDWKLSVTGNNFIKLPIRVNRAIEQHYKVSLFSQNVWLFNFQIWQVLERIYCKRYIRSFEKASLCFKF